MVNNKLLKYLNSLLIVVILILVFFIWPQKILSQTRPVNVLIPNEISVSKGDVFSFPIEIGSDVEDVAMLEFHIDYSSCDCISYQGAESEYFITQGNVNDMEDKVNVVWLYSGGVGSSLNFLSGTSIINLKFKVNDNLPEGSGCMIEFTGSNVMADYKENEIDINLEPSQSQLVKQKSINVENGDLIKSENNSAVYLISENKTRIFPHIAVYKSWGYSMDFSNIKVISENKLNQFEDGNPVCFRDGSLFRGTQSSLYGKESSAVFAVSDSKIRPIKSGATYQNLYNDPDWSRVVWVPDNLLSKFKYPLGQIVEDASSSLNGSLIKYSDNDTIYLVDNGEKRVVTKNGLSSNRLNRDKIININKKIANSSLPTSEVIINEEKDYLINPAY